MSLDKVFMALFSSIAQVQNRKNTVHPLQRRAVMASEFMSKTRLQESLPTLQSSLKRELCHIQLLKRCSNPLSGYLLPGKAEDTAQCRTTGWKHWQKACVMSWGLMGINLLRAFSSCCRENVPGGAWECWEEWLGGTGSKFYLYNFMLRSKRMSFHNSIQQFLGGKKEETHTLKALHFFSSFAPRTFYLFYI